MNVTCSENSEPISNAVPSVLSLCLFFIYLFLSVLFSLFARLSLSLPRPSDDRLAVSNDPVFLRLPVSFCSRFFGPVLS